MKRENIETLCNVMLYRGRWIGMARADGRGKYVAIYVNPFEWVAPLHEGKPIKDSVNMIVYERVHNGYKWNGIRDDEVSYAVMDHD